MTSHRCGAAVAAMTVISYYGSPVNNTDVEEGRIARERRPTVSATPGINPEQISSWFNRNGWKGTWGTGGSREMLRTNLDAGIPPMVEWMDGGGHRVVVTGHDTRGRKSVRDD
jgi:hypothetical protein